MPIRPREVATEAFWLALIVGFLGSLSVFPLTPLGSYWSRRHEWQADAFATALTRNPEALASALGKLANFKSCLGN